MLFEEAPDPYFVADLEGNLLDCNRAVEPLIGLSADKLIGKNFADMGLMAPEQIEGLAEILARLPNGVFTRPPEVTITRPEGKEIIVDLRMIPIQTKGQTQILGIGHDITWRKQAELQMKAHIGQLETLSLIDDRLTRRLDIHYVQTLALDTMMDLSGANVGSIVLIDEAETLNVYSIGYPEELNQHYSLAGRSIAARVARQRKAEWIEDVTADPDYFCVLDDTCSQITIPLVSQERLVGIINLETNQSERFNGELFELLKLIGARIAVAIDNAQLYATSQKQLAELQSLYEKVSQLEQLKTDMIRLAAHDLRNPLTNILTRTHLLRKTLEDQLTQKQQSHIDVIDDAVEQMQTMITDFLSLERIEVAVQDESRGQQVNLSDLVQRVFDSLCEQAEEKAQVYRLFSPEASLLVRGSEIEIQQVIANLIANAIKYTPEGGTIDVSLKRQNKAARFEVVDTGYGIPADQQENIFQPFFRAQTDETKFIEGTGLGLYLVMKFIERNHGEIIFYSEYHKGSTFGFTIPYLSL